MQRLLKKREWDISHIQLPLFPEIELQIESCAQRRKKNPFQRKLIHSVGMKQPYLSAIEHLRCVWAGRNRLSRFPY